MSKQQEKADEIRQRIVLATPSLPTMRTVAHIADLSGVGETTVREFLNDNVDQQAAVRDGAHYAFKTGVAATDNEPRIKEKRPVSDSELFDKAVNNALNGKPVVVSLR